MKHTGKAVTMKDVANRAGVSTATISRVLNNDPGVLQKTRDKVLSCMDAMGYRVNPIARSLKTQRTHTVGIIAPEFQNDFFMAVAEGIEEELQKAGYITFICNSRESEQEEITLTNMLIEKQVDGVIIIPASSSGDHYSALREAGLPYVLVDRLIDGQQTDAVLTDNYKGAYTAIEHCILNGADTIGFIGGDMRLTSARERYSGYIAAMAAYGKPIDKKLITFGDMHIDSGFELMGQLLSHKPDLSYVFIVNLFMRIGAEKYLVENRIAHPVAIAAFDESSITTLLQHTFVTVKQPLSEIGIQAAQLLLQRIKHEEIAFPQIYRLNPTVLQKPWPPERIW